MFCRYLSLNFSNDGELRANFVQSNLRYSYLMQLILNNRKETRKNNKNLNQNEKHFLNDKLNY